MKSILYAGLTSIAVFLASIGVVYLAGCIVYWEFPIRGVVAAQGFRFTGAMVGVLAVTYVVAYYMSSKQQ